MIQTVVQYDAATETYAVYLMDVQPYERWMYEPNAEGYLVRSVWSQMDDPPPRPVFVASKRAWPQIQAAFAKGAS